MKMSKISAWKMLVFEFKLCFGNCPILMVAEILASIIHGFSFVLVTIMTQKFFDKATVAIGHPEYLKSVMIWAVLLGITVIANQIVNGAENYLWEVVYNKLYGFSYLKLFNSIAEVSAEEFENTSFMDELKKAYNGAEHFIQPLFLVIGLSTFYLSYFFGMGFYIFTMQPILSLAIVLVFIPSFAGQFLKIYLYSKLADESASHERRFEYYEQCICGKEYLKETRTLKASSFFKKLYNKELEILSSQKWKTNKKAAMISALVRSITLLGYMGILILFVVELLNGKISVGAFSALFISIGKLFSMMDEVIETIGECTENIGLMKNYLKFLEYIEDRCEKNKDSGKVDYSNGIELKNVCYRYKDSDMNALEHINICIKPGETIAIVGENGSGKTTLVKLLTGMFRPSFGTIQYGDIDSSMYDRKTIYSKVSIVSQFFQKYKMSLRQNITISVKNFDNMENKDESIDKLLQYVGVDTSSDRFSSGLDTMLSKEFEGIDLSGGQWQRIAIARGLYKEHELFVLDEPTAAIDPIEESKLFELFSELLKDKTTVIVTHRLGCVKLADRIIVIDNGRIAEEGTHEQLLDCKGKYYEMYNAQAKWYVW